jgi:hypothetical protein
MYIFMKRMFQHYSDGHQFHQYQQNRQPPLPSTELTEHEKNMTYKVKPEIRDAIRCPFRPKRLSRIWKGDVSGRHNVTLENSNIMLILYIHINILNLI